MAQAGAAGNEDQAPAVGQGDVLDPAASCVQVSVAVLAGDRALG
ncbi:hypothetical protein [Streptomyces sp. NPDC018957]